MPIRLITAAVAALSIASPAAADSSLAGIRVFSPPPAAGASDGSSDHTAFSQDNRDVRVVAFDSLATNLVAADTNGRRDVFALLKQRGAGKMGGQLVRVSVGARGAQGNGDSSMPSVDGTTGGEAHCVAFESAATNLAPGARSHESSVYVRNLRAHRTSLVSIGSRSATHASIDGACSTVAYEAGGWVLVRDLRSRQVLHVARGENPDQQTDGLGVAYDHAGQVYLQRIAHRGAALVRRGRAILISNARTGAPANGASTKPAVDDHGDHVAFQSTATDLGDVDRNGPVSDVLLRTLRPTAAAPSMRLISTFGDNQWDGPSGDAVISRAGHEVVFDTTGHTLYQRYAGPGSNVYRWYQPSSRTGATMQLVSGADPFRIPDSIFNGPSSNPSISSRGNYIAFTSWASGVDGETNGAGISDVFMRFLGLNSQGLPTY
jgi:TolB protein